MSSTGRSIFSKACVYTAALALPAALLAWVLFPAEGWKAPAGVAGGALIGLFGLWLIIGFSAQVTGMSASSAKSRAAAGFALRYILYGILMAALALCGIPLLAVLAGFLCSKLALLIYSYSLRKES